MQRYAAERNIDGAVSCEQILRAAPDRAARLPLWVALDEAWRGRATIAEAPAALVQQEISDWQADHDNVTLARLAIRFGHQPARDHVLAGALDTSAEESMRVATLGILAELGTSSEVARLIPLLGPANSAAIHSAALRAFARTGDPQLADAILAAYPQMSPALRSQARDVLLSKRDWARRLLDQVAGGTIEPQEIPLDQLRVVAAHDEEELNALVRKYWGVLHQATPEERLAVARRLNNDLRAAVGRADAGREIFRRQCGTCHTLFGEGEKIGPELTHANRRDRDFLLASIVDPSAVVRKEFTNYTVQTTDGRIVTGLLAEQDANSVTVLTAKNERLRLPRSDVENITESPQSLMPDNIAEQLSPQNLRDLFAWLESQPDAK